MKRAKNFDEATFRPRVGEEEGKQLKTKLMRDHFAEVDNGDVCLVINNEKNGKPNYIGGNVLMEMALAFFQNKPIVLLNEIPDESVYLDEIIGMQPFELHGKIEDLTTVLQQKQ
jgi:hypothetical protein